MPRGIRRIKGPQQTADPVNPSHYKSHPSGVECIQITRHMTFNIGNVVKYCWRAGLKPVRQEGAAVDSSYDYGRLQDLRKAAWYLADEIKQLEALEAS